MKWLTISSTTFIPVSNCLRGTPACSRAAAGACGKLRVRVHRRKQVVEHLLIGQLQLAKVFPPCVIIQPDVRDNEPLIVRVLWIGLIVHAHDATDELDIGRKAAVRSEDGRHTQARMVESLTYEHRNLDHAVKATVAQRIENNLAFFFRHIAMDFGCAETEFFVEERVLGGNDRRNRQRAMI